MKAQTQIKIGVWTAIVMAGLILLTGLDASYRTMAAKRREYAIAAQKKAYLKEEARKLEEWRAKTSSEKPTVMAEPIHAPMRDQDMKIEQQFQLEAQQNVSYISTLFPVIAGFFFGMAFLILFAYSAHRRFFWMNTTMLIIMVIGLYRGYRKRTVNHEDFVYLCFILPLLVLLLQPMLGMLRESKQRVENPQNEG